MRICIFYVVLCCGFLGVSQELEESLLLTTNTGDLYGSLVLPTSSTPVPLVLIIAGSGPTDRNGNNPMMSNNSLRFLAEGLSKHGIASFRYDKRGVAKSTAAVGKEHDLRFEHYVADAVQWVALLKKDARFSSLVVLGHSEGALIGTLVAQEVEVSKYISLAGAGIPAADIIRKQLKQQAPTVLSMVEPILEKLEAGEEVAEVPPMLFSLFRPSVQPYLISWFKQDPAVAIASLKIPVQIIQGTTDLQMSVSDANVLSAALPTATLEVIMGMNHVLKEVTSDPQKNNATYANPTLALHAGLLEVLVPFILK